MADTERAHDAAKWQPDGKMFLNGSTGIALMERAAHAARELGPFSDKLDGFLGQLGLIAVKMMKQPLPDCSDDLAMLAQSVRD